MEADFADGFDSGSPWEGSDNFPLGGNTFGTIIEDGRDGTSSPSNDEPQTVHLDFESLTADQVANLSPTVIKTLTASQLRSTVRYPKVSFGIALLLATRGDICNCDAPTKPQ